MYMDIKNLIPGISEVVPHLYDELTDKAPFEQLFNEMLSSKESAENPTIVHMLGIPGCGKSTFIKQNKDKHFANYLIIGFDNIMESLPAYHEDIIKLGSVEAFKKWEIPARIAGYELLARAIEKKLNILFDHGGSPACHLELMSNIKSYGYKTVMYELSCKLDEAIRRVKIREMRTKRHTPENMIRQRYELLKNRGFDYMLIVDEFHIIDTSRNFKV